MKLNRIIVLVTFKPDDLYRKYYNIILKNYLGNTYGTLLIKYIVVF